MIHPPGSPAIILTRVSTDAQTDNTSHGTQFEHCNSLCESHGWRVVKRFEETESGASYLARLETQEAIEMIERGEARVLVMYDVSRYGRDTEYQLRMLRRICAAGGQLQLVTLRLEYGTDGQLTPESLMVFTLLLGNSSMERQVIRRRLVGGLLKKAREGKQPARSLTPMGYHIVQNKDVIRGEYPPGSEGDYIIIQVEAWRLQVIFDTYERLGSYREACAWLDERGLPPRSGGKWWPSTLRHVITNPIYKGQGSYCRHSCKQDDSRLARGLTKHTRQLRDESEWIKFPVPAIIDEQQWDRVNAISKEGNATRSGPHRRYFLGAHAFCGSCGFRLGVRITPNQKMGSYYSLRCRRSWAKTRTRADEVGCTNTIGYSGELLERLTMGALRYILLQPDLIKNAHTEFLRTQTVKASRKPLVDVAALHREIAQLKRREVAAVEAAIDARIAGQDHSPYEAARLNAQAQRERVERRLTEIQTPSAKVVSFPTLAAPMVEEMLSQMEDTELPILQRVSLLESLIEGVYPIAASPETELRKGHKTVGATIVLKNGIGGPKILVHNHITMPGQASPRRMEQTVCSIEILQSDVFPPPQGEDTVQDEGEGVESVVNTLTRKMS
jgi:site-specific DNA recombinase